MTAPHDLINKLKTFDLALVYTNDFPKEDEDFVFDCLMSKHTLVAAAATQVALDLPKPGVMRFLKTFNDLSDDTQRTALKQMISLDFVEVYIFILDLLKQAEYAEKADYIATCLSKTEYLVFPLILNRLANPTITYKSRLTRLVRMMHPDKWAPFLCALPLIPHENFFRNAWSPEIVEQMKAD